MATDLHIHGAQSFDCSGDILGTIDIIDRDIVREWDARELMQVDVRGGDIPPPTGATIYESTILGGSDLAIWGVKDRMDYE